MLMLLPQGLLNWTSLFPKSKSKYSFVGNIHEGPHANSSYFSKFIADSNMRKDPATLLQKSVNYIIDLFV